MAVFLRENLSVAVYLYEAELWIWCYKSNWGREFCLVTYAINEYLIDLFHYFWIHFHFLIDALKVSSFEASLWMVKKMKIIIYYTSYDWKGFFLSISLDENKCGKVLCVCMTDEWIFFLARLRFWFVGSWLINWITNSNIFFFSFANIFCEFSYARNIQNGSCAKTQRGFLICIVKPCWWF